jgi:hypothetical protein
MTALAILRLHKMTQISETFRHQAHNKIRKKDCGEIKQDSLTYQK